MTKSWVIVEIATGKAVFETFNEKLTKKINLDKYKVVPILEYLVALNRSIKEGGQK
jgi:hypothetical protein